MSEKTVQLRCQSCGHSLRLREMQVVNGKALIVCSACQNENILPDRYAPTAGLPDNAQQILQRIDETTGHIHRKVNRVEHGLKQVQKQVQKKDAQLRTAQAYQEANNRLRNHWPGVIAAAEDEKDHGAILRHWASERLTDIQDSGPEWEQKSHPALMFFFAVLVAVFGLAALRDIQHNPMTLFFLLIAMLLTAFLVPSLKATYQTWQEHRERLGSARAEYADANDRYWEAVDTLEHLRAERQEDEDFVDQVDQRQVSS